MFICIAGFAGRRGTSWNRRTHLDPHGIRSVSALPVPVAAAACAAPLAPQSIGVGRGPLRTIKSSRNLEALGHAAGYKGRHDSPSARPKNAIAVCNLRDRHDE